MPSEKPYQLGWRIPALVFGLHASLVAVYWLMFGSYEVSDDVRLVYVPLADHPLAHYRGEDALGQYPPLLGFVLAVSQLFSFLNQPAVAIKLLFSVFNTFNICTLIVFLQGRRTNSLQESVFAAAIVVAFILFPVIVVPQDEVIATFFVMATLGTRFARHLRAAWLALGVAAAKIFLVPYLVIELLGSPRARDLAFRLLTAGAVLGASYALFSGRSFVPGNEFGISLWSLSMVRGHLPPRLMYDASLLLFIGSCAMIMAVRCLKAGSLLAPCRDLTVTDYVLFMWVYVLTFYHVSPEYYFMVLLPMLCLHGMRFGVTPLATSVALLLCFAWLLNCLHGVGKIPAVAAMYENVLAALGLNPAVVMQGGIAAFNLASLAVLLRCFSNRRLPAVSEKSVAA